MISAPYFPLQNKDNLPPGFEWKDFGDGTEGFRIYPTGDSRPQLLTQRVCPAQGETQAVRTSWLIRNQLEASGTGYEGVGHSLQTMVRNGTSVDPGFTWHDNPWVSGDPERLITEKTNEFVMHNFVSQIPYDKACSFIDASLGIRGFGGYIDVKSAALRNHYVNRFITNSTPGVWNTFQRQPSTLFDGSIPETFNRYMPGHAVRIARGQPFKRNAEMFVNRAHFRFHDGNGGYPNARFILFLGLKMRVRATGASHWYGGGIDSGAVGSGNIVTDVPVSVENEIIAPVAYDYAEPIAMFAVSSTALNLVDNSTWSIDSIELDHSGVRSEVLVDDAVSTGS